MLFTTSRKLRQMAAGAVVVPLVLLGLSACGTGGVTSAHANSVIMTVDKGDEITPAEFVSEFKKMYDDQDSAKTIMDMEVGGQKMHAEGAVDWSDGTKAQMSMEVMGMKTDTIMVDNVMYMKGMDASGKYVKIDLAEMGDKLGMDYTKQMNPSTALDSLQDAITKVVYQGTEEVDGKELRHYTVTIDGAKMLASTGMDSAATEGMDIPESITQEMFLDDAGLLRRTEMKGEGIMPTMTMTIPEYGVAVDVSAPPSDEVTEMPDLSTMMESPAA